MGFFGNIGAEIPFVNEINKSMNGYRYVIHPNTTFRIHNNIYKCVQHRHTYYTLEDDCARCAFHNNREWCDKMECEIPYDVLYEFVGKITEL